MLVMSLIFSRHYPSIFTLFYFSCILSYIIASPISTPKTTLYLESINFLITNNCKMPNEVYIPFSSNSDPDTFDYLSTQLHICQTEEAEKEDEIARSFCTEVFEVLQNITCVDYNISLPKINSSRFSNDVCRDFSEMRDALPKQTEGIAGKLTDEAVCKLLCSHKYEPVCKTLVWSYDVLAQIKSAFENKAKEEKNTDMSIPVSNDLNTKGQIINVSNIEQQQNNAKINNENVGTNLAEGSSIALKQTKNIPANENIDDVNNGVSINSKTSLSVPSVLSNKSEIAVAHKKDKNNLIVKAISPSEKNNDVALTNASEQNTEEQKKEQLEPNKKSKEDLNEEEGEEQDNIHPEELMLNDHSPNEKVDQNADQVISLTPISNVEKIDQNEKSFDDMNKDVTNNVQANGKSENSLPLVTVDDELNSIQEQENKIASNKIQANSKTSTAVDKIKNTEKAKETESAISSVVVSGIPDLTTIQITAEKNDDDQTQEDRDQDQYNTENEDDYPKEYENQQTKDKDAELKNPITSEGANLNGSPVDPFMSSRNNFVREHDEVQIVPAFPAQEDGHFFFYFLSIVLILMAGYLIFHNKQKIIALIVEGRHERRRRSHGAGYKKLETK